MQALSKAESSAFIGNIIQFSALEFTSGTHHVSGVHYEAQRFRATKLVDEFMILPTELGIYATWVRKVDVEDQSGHLIGLPGDTVLIKSPTELIWYWKGVFFGAQPCKGLSNRKKDGPLRSGR